MSEQELTVREATAMVVPDIPFSTALDAKITELIALFTEYSHGGFKTREFIAFVFQSVYALALLAKLYVDTPEREKQDQVVDALRRVYMSRNPDLPWLPEPFESLVEGFAFGTLAPEFYKFIVRVL